MSELGSCCLLQQDLYKNCARGGGVKRGDVCYGMLRAAVCVDESDHHALMYVRHGQTVREEGVRVSNYVDRIDSKNRNR